MSPNRKVGFRIKFIGQESKVTRLRAKIKDVKGKNATRNVSTVRR